jgi:PKD repeat protein
MYIIFALALVVGLCAVTITKQPVANAVLPPFYANDTVVAVGEPVYFTNWTMQVAVMTPYTKAEWDFNNDGVYEITLTGSAADAMSPDVCWAYSEPGVYTVRLRMTDSAPTTRYYTRDDYITVNNQTELNPLFQANKTVVVVGEPVIFTNLTTVGMHPYTKAEWDFDNDGVYDITLTGSESNTMTNVTWAYSEPGVYTVRLQMTDSAPTTRYVIRDSYIIVGIPPPPEETWGMPYGLDEDPIAINLYQFPGMATTVTLADIEDTMPAQFLVVWNYGGPGVGWRFFVPGWGASNTLTQLVPGTYYVGIVSTATSWEIPQE